jgi:hypothetical protein
MPTRVARRCTEMLPQETYFARDGVRDMFWPHAMNASAIAQVGAHLLPCTIHRCRYRYMRNDRCCNRAIAATRSAAALPADHSGLFGSSRGCRVATA